MFRSLAILRRWPLNQPSRKRDENDIPCSATAATRMPHDRVKAVTGTDGGLRHPWFALNLA